MTTQYDRHQVQCGCGRVHVADAPPEAPGAPGTVTYGLSFQAWCVFLMVMHHVPMERCADIIEPMAGIRPSDGVGAQAAGACRPGGRGSEQGDPGADHPRPGHFGMSNKSAVGQAAHLTPQERARGGRHRRRQHAVAAAAVAGDLRSLPMRFSHRPGGARKLDKRCAHRADGEPGSARSRFRWSEMLRGQGRGRTADLPLFRELRLPRSGYQCATGVRSACDISA